MQMTMPKIGELIKSGRAFVAEEWGLIVMAVFGIPLGVEIVASVLQKILAHSVLSVVISIASIVISLLVSLGATHIVLALVDGKGTSISEIFSRSELFWKYLWASILYGFAVVVGFMLFIIPGVYLALKYGFYRYVVVDRPELSVIDTLKESARLTDGIKWELLIFSFVLIGINFLGLLALGMGLLYTIPVSAMAYAALYRSLTRIAAGTVVSSAAAEGALASEGISSEAPVA